MIPQSGRRAGTLLGLALVVIAPVLFARIVLPDAPPPAGLSRPIRDFSDAIWHLSDRPPWTHARFVDIETGPDDLIVLYFEVRNYPYLVPDAEVYLVTRCAPIDALDPTGMGGGVVQGSRATDAELQHLRSDAQPPCEGAKALLAGLSIAR